jgi:hypothetical protein
VFAMGHACENKTIFALGCRGRLCREKGKTARAGEIQEALSEAVA